MEIKQNNFKKKRFYLNKGRRQHNALTVVILRRKSDKERQGQEEARVLEERAKISVIKLCISLVRTQKQNWQNKDSSMTFALLKAGRKEWKGTNMLIHRPRTVIDNNRASSLKK